MTTLIHGTDIESSRNFYFQIKSKAKNPVLLEGENLLYSDFFKYADGSTIFNTKPAIFIENFLTKNKSSNDFKKIVDYINKSKDLEVVFWESSQLTQKDLSFFEKAQIKAFSIPKNMFLFLDSLKSGNSSYLIKLFKSLRSSAADELILFMMIRQFRLLLSQSHNLTKNIDEANRLAIWQKSKIKSQVNQFKISTTEIYHKLFEIEVSQKTGKLPYSLEKSIDFFLADL